MSGTSHSAASWDPAPSLLRHLESLVGERSPAGAPGALRRAEEYALEVFRAAGWSATPEPIAAGGGMWRNIVADAGPVDRPLFIVGAHLDTVERTPGADDNASGVAALLSLAEWAGARLGLEASPGPAVRLVAFNLEEVGMVGSAAHARGLSRAGIRIEGMIALEMLGYVAPGPQRYPPGLGIGRRARADFISVVGNRASRRLADEVAAALASVPGLPVETVCLPEAAAALIGATLSDHSSFWAHGQPAVMVGDTSFYRNPHYHLPGDTLDTLSLPFLEKVTRGLATFLEPLLGSHPPM
jgi:Zn-dependent M28 family amino/carboxypeptidase